MLTAILIAAQLAGASPGDSVPADLLQRRESAAWRLIATLQSPFCPGLTLESCPSWYADSLRTVIRERMARGEPAERIRVELARDFGQRVLGEPTWQGFDVTGWIGPGLLIAVSAVLLGLGLRRGVERGPANGRRGRPGFVSPLPELPGDERARLEEQLRRELALSESAE
jgi:cytochrome c-type biogenesis protein CcmH/NrfF